MASDPVPLSAFELVVLRSVGHTERHAIEITLRAVDRMPPPRFDTMAQWLFGAEVWRVLQSLVAEGLVATRPAHAMFSPIRDTNRKSYRLTLLGLDALEHAETDEIMARVKEETPTIPAPPDTQPDLALDVPPSKP